MTTRHHSKIMAVMPEHCQDNDCRHTNWGGRGRAHEVQTDCAMYLREQRRLEVLDAVEFDKALGTLPKNNQNAKISFDRKTGQVSMPLEAFLALSQHFKGNVTYGVKQQHGGEGGDDTSVYELYGMPFKDARDLAEFSGAQLMQKFNSGWMEA